MLAENEELETETTPESEQETIAEPAEHKSSSLETGDLAEEASAQEEQEKPKPKPKPARRSSSPKVKQIVSWFSVCARCSFFLAGYKTAVSDEALDEAATAAKGGWMTLAWNQDVCRLVHKSYGSRLDMDCFHYDGICPDCRRTFVFRGGDEEEGETSQFRIEVKPGAGR
ncbi:MAG: hypothetical protein ACE5FD_18945 [Anaerolineae bacterium]